jgi:S1-C subfamily serine protease
LYVTAGSAQAPESGSVKGDDDTALESQLEAARKQLDEAARKVAELSAQMGKPLIHKLTTLEGQPGRAIIGVQLDGLGAKGGAVVREVSPGGPAADAGIRVGDVIVAVNGTEVKGDDPARQVVKIMRQVKPEQKLAVKVLRDGKPREFTVTARPGPDGFFAFSNGPMFDFQSIPIPPLPPQILVNGQLADMELATLTPRLGTYFGTDKGVLVVRAPPDGGLKLEDGDVILAIDGREPTSGSHATRILASYQPGEKISIRIMRERKTLNLETALPEGMHRTPGRGAMLEEGVQEGGVVTGPGRPAGEVGGKRKVLILQGAPSTI